MQKEVANLKKEIDKIKARNKRVEQDKAWETSWTRKLFIMMATYGVVVLFMLVTQERNPYLKALLPAIGYILSSISYDAVKMWWLKRI